MKTTFANDFGLDVAVTIQNTGSVAGDEVAQVYLNKPANAPTGVQFAPDILAGFERVRLAPGESKQVVIHVPRRQLEYWSTAQHQWVNVAGTRRLWVGSSSRDRKLEGQVKISAK
jgi:beta-glucosidase